ncbi:MAG: thioredoxin family protein [Anaerolineae bacterium]|nr:thioredoxin family protein [Anaerolineae bacterium]
MFDRLIITLVIVGGLSLLWLAWQSYRSTLVRTIQPSRLFVGKPTLLYFTAGYCVICKAQQSPIVAQVAAKFGDSIAVKQVDVSERPDLASQYKVLTLPTTVVLDSQGQVTHINYGVAHQSKLEAQLL